jgi:formylglycine-generating enzyme required for sulfatase activity
MSKNRHIGRVSVAAACGMALIMTIAGCGKYHAPVPKRAQSRPESSRAPSDFSGSASEPALEPDEPEVPTTVERFALPTREFAIELPSGVRMEFVGIPAGSFTMGNRATGVRRHRETIAKPFYLGKYEVTQEQWRAVMGNNPSLHQGPPQRPVERVQWDDCQAFLAKLNAECGKTGMPFGLPTEAQWEFACRAGAALRSDATDSSPERIGNYGWFAANAKLETHPVGQKLANAWGLYDMHGNVAEWCADNAAPTAGGEFHVVRGGGWKDGARDCASTSRVERRGRVSLRFDGFRVLAAPVK